MAVKFIIKVWNPRDIAEFYGGHFDEGIFLYQIGGAKPFDTYEEAQEIIEIILSKWDFYILQIEKVFYKPK